MSKYCCIIFILAIIFVVSTFTETPKEPTKTQKPHTKTHQNLKSKLQKRSQYPQKCHIICPNSMPIDIPENFINNCSNYRPNQDSSTVPVPTTIKPSSTGLPSSTVNSTAGTNDGADDDSDDEDEKDTESPQTNGTQITTGKTRIARKRDKILRKHKNQQKRSKKLKTKHNKTPKTRKWQKVTVRSSSGINSPRYRLNLNGCYVVCSNPVHTGGVTNSGGGSDFIDEGDDEDDEDDGPYVTGEDWPLEYTVAPRPLFPLAEIDFLNLADEFLDAFDFPFEGRRKKTSQIRKKTHLLKNRNHAET